MNGSTPKKRARDLQRITGMPYQSAHRAVMAGGDAEYFASVRSGLNFRDFVTPREMRIWHLVNGTGEIDCDNGIHWMPTEGLGQCVGCSVYMAEFRDNEGEPYEAPIDEAEFLRRCAVDAEFADEDGTGIFYDWAPPMGHLNGSTQLEYVEANRHPGWPRPVTPNPWDLQYAADPNALTSDQIDLLRAVAELQTPDAHPSTKDVGARMLELAKEHSGTPLWSASAPWHGTNPAADQLRSADLVKVHVGMASQRPPAGSAGRDSTDVLARANGRRPDRSRGRLVTRGLRQMPRYTSGDV